MKVWPVVGLAITILSMPAEAYYHYVHYLNGNVSAPVYEEFNLASLPSQTVTFFAVDSGPQSFGTNDDFSSVLSQIEQAAATWNSVTSSALRVAFGGLESQGQVENTPGGDVVFVDLPPGVLGLGGTDVPVSATPVNGPNGPFFPIVRSIMELTANTATAPGPSYLESFFTTAVHEMGHALGLQHTWTSAAMAQDVIRNTSRTRPIDADDIASLSVLYGPANWAAGYGSISGQVTANGQPVALASVVAIPPAGPAVSSLTNPDGTYTISGLPPGNYLLYVHPLPPDAILPDNAGLRLPVDQNGNALQPSGPFFTTFYPVNNQGSPQSFSISPGTVLTGENFAVTPESAVSMYDMVTYSWNSAGTESVSPAFVNSIAAEFTIEAIAAPGLVTPVPQSVTILGGFGTASLCAPQNATLPCFEPYQTSIGPALALYFTGSLAGGIGPRHLMFTMPNGDLYVLPDGVNLVQQGPPAIGSVVPNGDGTVTVSGSTFGAGSVVYFDGLPALSQGAVGETSTQESVVANPPSGYSGQIANVIVYNSDGQNSTFYQPLGPPTYTYPASGTPQIAVNPASLPSGVSSMVDITAANMQFVSGQITVGMGTSDVSVRRVWVLGPTHLVANVVAVPGAAIGSSEISVLSGFQRAVEPGAFELQPANPSLPSIGLPIVNNDPNQAILYPGAAVSVYGTGLAIAPNSTTITLNGQAVQVLYASATQVNFAIPSTFPTGLAVLILNNGLTSAPPLEIEIDNPPPVIQQVVDSSSGQVLTASNAASSGDFLVATVSNVPPSAATSGLVQVTMAGIQMLVAQVQPGAQTGTAMITFQVGQSFGGASVPVIVTVNGVSSDPYPVTVN